MAALAIESAIPSTSGLKRSKKKYAKRILIPEEEAPVFACRRHRFDIKEFKKPSSAVQTDDTLIFRKLEQEGIPGLVTPATSQTRSDEADVKKRCSQTQPQHQTNTPLNFFCPSFRCRRILLFIVAFLLLPGIQRYLWSAHWALTDRKIRAVSSCLITAIFSLNMILVRRLALSFRLSSLPMEAMMNVGLPEHVPGLRSDHMRPV